MPSYRGLTTRALLLSACVLAVQAVFVCADIHVCETEARLQDNPERALDSGGQEGDFRQSWLAVGRVLEVLLDFDDPIKLLRSVMEYALAVSIITLAFVGTVSGLVFAIVGIFKVATIAPQYIARATTTVILWITRMRYALVFTFLCLVASVAHPHMLVNSGVLTNSTGVVHNSTTTLGAAAPYDPMTGWLTLVLFALLFNALYPGGRHAGNSFSRAFITTLCFPISLIAAIFGYPVTCCLRRLNKSISYVSRVHMRLLLLHEVGCLFKLEDSLAHMMVFVTTIWCLFSRYLIFVHLLPFAPVVDVITGQSLLTPALMIYRFTLMVILWCGATLVSEACAWLIYREVAGRRYEVPHWWQVLYGSDYRRPTDWMCGISAPLLRMYGGLRFIIRIAIMEPFEPQSYVSTATDSVAKGTAHAWARVKAGWHAVVTGKEKRMCKHTTMSFLTGYNLTGTQMVFIEELLVFIIGCSRTNDNLLLALLARNFLMRVLASSDADARTLPEMFKQLQDRLPLFKSVLAVQEEAPSQDKLEEMSKIVGNQHQAFTDTLKAASGAMAHLETNRNVINLLTVIAGVMGVASYCDKSSRNMDFNTILENLQKQVTNFTATTKVLDALQSLASVLATCYGCGDWTPLLFPINPIQKWIEAVKDLATETTNLGANLHQDVVKDLVSRLIDLQLERDRLSPKANAIGATVAKEFHAATRVLLTTRMSLDAIQATSTLRQEPLGVILFGPPKIGKSFFTDILHVTNQMAGGLNLKDTTSSYTYTGDTAFLDGLRSNCRTFILDDVGKNNPKALPMDPAIGTIIGVINTVPYQPNMASLENKGNITFRPTLVVATTNTKHLNAASYVSTPNAVWRRFPLVVTLSVKERYRAPGTRQLDTKRLMEAGAEAYDNDLSNVWDIMVEQPILSEHGGEPTYRLIENFSNVREFMIYLKGRINKQAQDFETAINAMDRVRGVDRCPTCFRCSTGSACVCGDSPVIQEVGFTDFLHASGPRIRALAASSPEVFSVAFPGQTLDQICQMIFSCSIKGFMSWGIDNNYLRLHDGTLDELFENDRVPVEVIIALNGDLIRQKWNRLLAFMGVNYDYVINYLTSCGVILDRWVTTSNAQKPEWLNDFTFGEVRRPAVIEPPPPAVNTVDRVVNAVEDAGQALLDGIGRVVGMQNQMAPGVDTFDPTAISHGAGVEEPPNDPNAQLRAGRKRAVEPLDISHWEAGARERHIKALAEKTSRVREMAQRAREDVAAAKKGQIICDGYPRKMDGTNMHFFSALLCGLTMMFMGSLGIFTVSGSVVCMIGVFGLVGKALDWRTIAGVTWMSEVGYNMRRIRKWVRDASDWYVLTKRVFHVTMVTVTGTLSVAAVLYLLVRFMRNAYPAGDMVTRFDIEPTGEVPAENFASQPFDDQVLPDAEGQGNVWAANAFRVNRTVPVYSATSSYQDVAKIIHEHVVFMEFYKDQSCTNLVCSFHGTILAKDIILTVTRDLTEATTGGARYVKTYQRDSALVRVQHFEPSSIQPVYGEAALSLVGLQTETISPLIKSWMFEDVKSVGPVADPSYNARGDVYMPVSLQYSRNYLNKPTPMCYAGRIVAYWEAGTQRFSLCPGSKQIVTSISTTEAGTCGLPLVNRDTKPFVLGVHVGLVNLENAKGMHRKCAVAVQVSLEVLKRSMIMYLARDELTITPGRSKLKVGKTSVVLAPELDHVDPGTQNNASTYINTSCMATNLRPAVGAYGDVGPKVAPNHILDKGGNLKDPYSEKWLGCDPTGDLKVTGYGTLLGPGQKPMSSGLPVTEVKSTPWRADAEAAGLSTNKVPPRFCDTMKTNGLRAMNGKLHAFPPTLVKAVAGALTQWYKNELRRRHADAFTKARENPIPEHTPFRVKKQRDAGHLFDTTGPLSLDAAVNGLGQTSCLKALNMNTSAGYPHACKKRALFTRNGTKWNIHPIMLSEIKAQRELYNSLNRVGTIFTASMKDEPISQRKADEKRGRVIFGAPVEYSILVRQLFGSFMVHVMRNADLYGCQVGVNPESARWGKLATELSEFGKMFACDYQKYDTEAFDETMMEATYRMMIDLNVFLNSPVFGVDHTPPREGEQGSAFTHADIKAMFGLQADTINPFVLYFGQLLRIAAINPSGHGLTVFLNSFGNTLLAACAYVVMQARKDGYGTDDKPMDSLFADNRNFPKIYQWVAQFKERVMMITYGDDFVASSKDDDFNFKTFQEVMREHGISITAADSAKSSNVDAPFLPLEEIDFLKRGFVYDPELTAAYQMACMRLNQLPKHEKIFRAPLRKEVIAKLFCLYMGSGEMDTDRKVEALRATWLACVQQSHEDYIKYVALIAEIASKHDVPEERLTFLDRSWADINIGFYLDKDDYVIDMEDPLSALSIGEDPDD